MSDPRQQAESLLGPVAWQSEVTGFCKCPGAGLHTSQTGAKDCRVSIDGAPTVFCFHASCAGPVADCNLRLRRILGASTWEIRLPNGQVLRSGDILQAAGVVMRRDVIMAGGGTASLTPALSHRMGEGGAAQGAERLVLETVRALAERFKPQLFDLFHWPLAAILADSPLLVAERAAEEQFRTWLRLWPPSSTIWIGDVFNSGKPEHATHFRAIADWYQIGPVMGNFTCGSSFKAGCYSRSNENCNGTRFMVIESDTLPKDEVGAIFSYLRRRLRYRLHCIVDTAGKSLHGWFDAPATKQAEARLKAGLTVFGCDPKLFTYSQPVRVPGAWRDGKLQRLVWLEQ